MHDHPKTKSARENEEVTTQIKTDIVRKSRLITADDRIHLRSGKHIDSLVKHEILQMKLEGRDEPEYFIVLSTDEVSRYKLAFLYPTVRYPSGQLDEVHLELFDESYSYIPLLAESFLRDYVCRSEDFSTLAPTITYTSSQLLMGKERRLYSQSDISRLMGWSIVAEHNAICAILSQRECLWKEMAKRSLAQR